jgi:hypothetical protein
LFAVDDVGAHRQEVTGIHQHTFDTVLDLFDVQPFDAPRAASTAPITGRRQPPVLAGGGAGSDQGLADFFGVEGNQGAVAFVQAGADQRAEHALH